MVAPAPLAAPGRRVYRLGRRHLEGTPAGPADPVAGGDGGRHVGVDADPRAATAPGEPPCTGSSARPGGAAPRHPVTGRSGHYGHGGRERGPDRGEPVGASRRPEWISPAVRS